MSDVVNGRCEGCGAPEVTRKCTECGAPFQAASCWVSTTCNACKAANATTRQAAQQRYGR